MFAANFRPSPPVPPPPLRKSPFERPPAAGSCGNNSAARSTPKSHVMHGMRRVGKGSRDVCERWAVGMLQPREAPEKGDGKKRKVQE